MPHLLEELKQLVTWTLDPVGEVCERTGVPFRIKQMVDGEDEGLVRGDDERYRKGYKIGESIARRDQECDRREGGRVRAGHFTFRHKPAEGPNCHGIGLDWEGSQGGCAPSHRASSSGAGTNGAAAPARACSWWYVAGACIASSLAGSLFRSTSLSPPSHFEVPGTPGWLAAPTTGQHVKWKS